MREYPYRFEKIKDVVFLSKGFLSGPFDLQVKYTNSFREVPQIELQLIPK